MQLLVGEQALHGYLQGQQKLLVRHAVRLSDFLVKHFPIQFFSYGLHVARYKMLDLFDKQLLSLVSQAEGQGFTS